MTGYGLPHPTPLPSPRDPISGENTAAPVVVWSRNRVRDRIVDGSKAVGGEV
jgi:hypothetical protein